MLAPFARFAADSLTALALLTPAEAAATIAAVAFAAGGLVVMRALHDAATGSPVNQVPRGPVYKKAA